MDLTQLAFDKLTGDEEASLAHYEEVIERGLQTFVEVGEALLTIRDKRLYRATHGTFEDYCGDRWDLDKPHAHRLIQASEITKALVPMGTIPTNERQARELAPLKDEPAELAEAWQQAVDTAPNGKVTAEHVREVVREYREPSPPPSARPPAYTPPSVIERPRPTAAEPVEVWSTEEQELQNRLRAGETVVVSFRCHQRLIAWAEERGLFVRIDRQSMWGNPFEMGKDGDRATVITNYRDHYFPNKPSLQVRLDDLKGKALGCWCAPEPCHGDVLREEAEG